MLFQSMGAHYSFGAAFRHLLTIGRPADAEHLRQALGQRYGGVASLHYKGRDALTAGIRAATGGAGKVAVSGLTCYSVIQAVEAAGCQPVYVDAREQDLHFSGSELTAALALHAGVKAVIIQNMLGIPADNTSIQAVARDHNLVVIEDLAHSAGATYADGHEVGTIGDITMLSFGKDKAIDAVNGGALIIRDEQYAVLSDDTSNPRAIEQLRDRLYPLIGWTTRVLFRVRLGGYFLAGCYKLGLAVRSADGEAIPSRQLPTWQARIALRQVRQLEQRVAGRLSQASRQATLLPDSLQVVGAGAVGASPIRLPLLVDNRDELLVNLKTAGIYTADTWYDIPVSPLRFYDRAHFPESECPVAVSLARRLVNVPTHPRVRSGDQRAVAAIVTRVAR